MTYITKSIKISLLLFLILFSGVLYINAEDSIDQEMAILLSCANSSDEQLQTLALNSILERFKKQGYLQDEVMEIPINLALRGVNSRTFNDGVTLKGNVNTQIRAIRILGKIGGQEALDALSQLLTSSIDSILLMEAVESCSLIKANEYSNYMNALGSAMKKQHSLYRDNGFAFAALSAIDSITLNQGNILTSEILGIMMIYSEGEYIQKVRAYSRKLLKSILTDR